MLEVLLASSNRRSVPLRIGDLATAAASARDRENSVCCLHGNKNPNPPIQTMSIAQEIRNFITNFYYPGFSRSAQSGTVDMSQYYAFPVSLARTNSPLQTNASADKWNAQISSGAKNISSVKALDVKVDAYTENGGVAHVVAEIRDSQNKILAREFVAYIVMKVVDAPGGFKIVAAFVCDDETARKGNGEWQGIDAKEGWKQHGGAVWNYHHGETPITTRATQLASELASFYKDTYLPFMGRTMSSGKPDTAHFYSFPLHMGSRGLSNPIYFPVAAKFDAVLAKMPRGNNGSSAVRSILVDAPNEHGGIVHAVIDSLDASGKVRGRETAAYVVVRDTTMPEGIKIVGVFAAQEVDPAKWVGGTAKDSWKEKGAVFGQQAKL